MQSFRGSGAAVRYNSHRAGIESDIWADARKGADFLWADGRRVGLSDAARGSTPLHSG